MLKLLLSGVSTVQETPNFSYSKSRFFIRGVLAFPPALSSPSSAFALSPFDFQEWLGQILDVIWGGFVCHSSFASPLLAAGNMERLRLSVQLVRLYWISQKEKFWSNKQSIVLIVKTVL